MKLLPLALAATALACGQPDRPVSIELWHGAEQRIGHLGDAQGDFNLMGIATGNEIVYVVNGGDENELMTSDDPWGFRRLGRAGHFNADIPIDSLEIGPNTVEVIARSSVGEARGTMTLLRAAAEPQGLPLSVRWGEVQHIQDVGQAVDGLWQLESGGLRSEEALYDRVFLLGDRTWQDYDVRTELTVNAVPGETAPMSGGNGLGFIMRFTGHSVSPPRFPYAQPKWGYQPFGAILWLRWTKGSPDAPPTLQFYRGDRDELEDASAFLAFQTKTRIALRARAVTDPADPSSTTYSMKAWLASGEEPEAWGLEVRQTAPEANTHGGVALVAHHVDVTFGDLDVTPVKPAPAEAR